MDREALPETADTTLAGALDELGKGLQAASNYIDAARRSDSPVLADPPGGSGLLDRAAGQLARARQAYSRLRQGLLAASEE